MTRHARKASGLNARRQYEGWTGYLDALEPRVLLSGSTSSLLAALQAAPGAGHAGAAATVAPVKPARTTSVAPAAMATQTVTAGSTAAPAFSLADTLSDQAQRTTLAFDGLAMMTGNLDAQSFFPPGKVADYFGFQYLRDNDPDNMGHNTSFLTRVANNVIYILDSTQLSQMAALATAQASQVDLYAYKRFTLMEAFRRLMDGDTPAGSSGLDVNAVKSVSRGLYLLDGQISFDRASLYASIIKSLTPTQKAYLDAMKGKGFNSWPNITDDQIRSKMQSLPQGAAVSVMTYASDLFSWYAGSVDADVYFCPERQGTYFGGFYIKDAPAVGHEGYSIDEQLTATAGAALCDSSKGYVTPAQAALVSSLVDIQRNNLCAGTTNIVQTRTQISTLLRSLMTSTASSDSVKAQVLALSGTYGDLDGEDNYNYATVFAQVYKTLTPDQKTKLTALRKSLMSGTYADGTPFDYSVCTTPFLYSSVITDLSTIAPYISNTDSLFTTAPAAAITLSASTVAENQPAGTTVGALSTTGQKAGQTFTYSLVSGTGGADNASFQIVGNALKTQAAFNYEARNTYAVRVRATDQSGAYTETAFTIVVSNVNERPTNVTLSATSIAENKPAGSLVGTLSGTDPDAGDTLAYSLVPGTGGGDNGLFSIAGNRLETRTPFNYEARNSYSILVRATDSGGLTFDKQVIIRVVDVNEAPTVGGFTRTVVHNRPLRLAAADFAAAFRDPDGNPLAKIMIGTLPTRGVLTLSGVAVKAGQEIPVSQLGALTYTPSGNYAGPDRFTWNGSDGSLYALTGASVDLIIM